MPSRIRSYTKLLVAFCLIVSFCLAQGEAQTRRKKRTRRSTPAAPRPVITNPPIAPPESTQSETTTGDVKIISTDDPEAQEPTSSTETKAAKPAASPEQESIQQTITSLTNQVNKLNDKLSKQEQDDRYQREMERLTRAEQRSEQLRSQLIDVQAKIANFEAALEQIDFALRPENIESSTAGYGSTRPEATRDARRKQLEGEKSRVTAQLKLVEQSKARLETAVASADSEVDLLRAKVSQLRDQLDAEPATTDPKEKPRKP